MLADFYNLSNDMKIAVQKNHFGVKFCTEVHRMYIKHFEWNPKLTLFTNPGQPKMKSISKIDPRFLRNLVQNGNFK